MTEISFLLFRFVSFLALSFLLVFWSLSFLSLFAFLSTKISHRDFITRNQSVGKVFPPFPLCLFLSLFFSPFASSPFLESQTCFSVLSSKVSYQLSLAAACYLSLSACLRSRIVFLPQTCFSVLSSKPIHWQHWLFVRSFSLLHSVESFVRRVSFALLYSGFKA